MTKSAYVSRRSGAEDSAAKKRGARSNPGREGLTALASLVAPPRVSRCFVMGSASNLAPGPASPRRSPLFVLAASRFLREPPRPWRSPPRQRSLWDGYKGLQLQSTGRHEVLHG